GLSASDTWNETHGNERSDDYPGDTVALRPVRHCETAAIAGIRRDNAAAAAGLVGALHDGMDKRPDALHARGRSCTAECRLRDQHRDAALSNRVSRAPRG